MTKAKAVEILNETYDGFLIAEKVCSDAIGEFDDKQLIRYRLDEITDKKIAILTAIDALEQSPTVEAEPMGEYISKQSVIDYLNGYLNSIGEDGTYNPLFDRGQRRALINSIQDISAIKAADVQPVKHGRWIEKRTSYMKWIPNDDDNVNPDDVKPERMTEQKCSWCKRWTIKFTDHIELDYCPLCGCKQDLDGDSE